MAIRIDKSAFTPEELATYEALIAKASVEPGTEPEKKEEEPMAKSAETSPEIAAALERLETLEKSIEMKGFTEIAKKYAPLGEKEEDLAKTLYDMKKSNEANYDAYVAVLDKSLDLVNKSGVFTEIGKSTSGTAGTVIDKVNAAADEIQKSDATITRDEAIAKAWIDHPEFVEEYEADSNSKR